MAEEIRLLERAIGLHVVLFDLDLSFSNLIEVEADCFLKRNLVRLSDDIRTIRGNSLKGISI